MAQERLLSADTYEERDIVWRNPAELLEATPPALVVNWASYNLIDANPDPKQFDTVKLLRVKVSKNGKSEIVTKIKDGCTRSKWALDKGTQVPAVDVTESDLKNPLIALPGERVENQEALTITQYLRAIVPPTAEHREIAEERIAAHLIDGWNSMVGEDIAWRFSATAALSFLGKSHVPDRDTERLEEYLRIKRRKRFLEEETKEAKGKIIDALLETSKILKETGLRANKVAESAFGLLAEGSVIVGEENKARRELFGLLYSSEIESKLEPFEEGIREQQRIGLGDAFFASVRRFSESEDAEEVFEATRDALNHPELSYQETLDVLNALSPQEKYDRLRRDKNIAKLTEAYKERVGREAAGIAQLLVEKIGDNPDYPSPYYEGNIIGGIEDANRLAQEVAGYIRVLQRDKGEILTAGVLEKDLKKTLEVLENRRRIFLSFKDYEDFLHKKWEFEKVFREQRVHAENKLNAYRLDNIITGVFGDDLDGDSRKDIQLYVLTQEAVEKPSGELDLQKAERLVRTISELDDSLRGDVFTGRKRLSFAISEQQRRGEQPPVKKARAELLSEEKVPEEVKKSPTKIPASKEEAEKERIDYGNARYTHAFLRAMEILDTTDIEREEVRPETMDKAIALIKRLGRLVYDIPDADKALKKHKESLLEKKRKTLEEVQVRSKRGY